MPKKAKIDRQELKELVGQARPRGRVGSDWVFQGCPPELSNCRDINRPNLMIRRRIIPRNPRTPEQTAHREFFRRGIDQWNALTPAQKAQYKARAKEERIVSGYILFMREFLNSAS